MNRHNRPATIGVQDKNDGCHECATQAIRRDGELRSLHVRAIWGGAACSDNDALHSDELRASRSGLFNFQAQLYCLPDALDQLVQ